MAPVGIIDHVVEVLVEQVEDLVVVAVVMRKNQLMNLNKELLTLLA